MRIRRRTDAYLRELLEKEMTERAPRKSGGRASRPAGAARRLEAERSYKYSDLLFCENTREAPGASDAGSHFRVCAVFTKPCCLGQRYDAIPHPMPQRFVNTWPNAILSPFRFVVLRLVRRQPM